MRKYKHSTSLLPQSDALARIAAKSDGWNKDQIAARIKEIAARLGALHADAQKLQPDQAAAIEVGIDKAPYLKMRASLDKVDRDIVFSFCQYGMGKVWQWGAQTGGNLWRTTGDINDNWKSVEDHGFNQNGLEQWAGPGHWNDPDMLEIGNGNLTPDENYTHMTLWCMLSAPLLIGCDMPKMSPFIISLFSNDEVLAVNQDALGKQGWRARQDGRTEVWMKPLADGGTAVAFFNRGDSAADVSVQWSDLKLSGPQSIRDLWRQKDIGVQDSGYTVNVAPHGAELFKAQKINKQPTNE
jgi:alpha-galactosidase